MTDRNIHILGICGTFMGGIALLAREAGITVSGSDQNVYPPMSTMLEEQGITISRGFDSDTLPSCDNIVVGNVMTRGKAVIESMLNRNLRYTSGPQWLYENILRDRWVLAVSGTHGKTTTSSILAWILESAGLNPGFLIGGVPENFGVSARLGDSPFFIVEADEYDTAFFDKRSKFVHYHPRTLIINNLEYDHADIFPDLESIKTQFHHLIRMVPGEGMIVNNGDELAVQEVLDKGCWTPRSPFTLKKPAEHFEGWSARLIKSDGSAFELYLGAELLGEIHWDMLGMHNVSNAIAAIAAARHAGVPVHHAIEALKTFKGIKRRMQLSGEVNGVCVYDDFAHHPTAIATTLQGLREKVGRDKIIAILEPRSNTMRMGVHKDALADSLVAADEVILYQPAAIDWNLQEVLDTLGEKASLFSDLELLISKATQKRKPGDQLLVMSNGGFGGIHAKLLQALEQQHVTA